MGPSVPSFIFIMSLLNDELDLYKKRTQNNKKWVLCDYCRVPFLTPTKNTKCSRCSMIDKNLLEYKSKIMLFFIATFVFTNILQTFICLKIQHLFQNQIYFFSFLSIITLIIGYIYWIFINKIR